jgi:F0F1-type ATP synthase alpha subunit
MRFFPRYNRYQDEYFAKAQELQSQLQTLRELEARKAPDSEIDKQIEKILNTRTEMSGLLSKYTKEFREVLSSQQMVELVLFERDFLDDMNRLLHRERADTTR